MMLSENFSIDKETLRKDFYSPENEPQRRWFFQHYKGTNRKQIQDKFYEFVERVKINVLFFDWFHAYAIRNDIDYPWKQDIIGDPTTNVITNWKVKDGELIQSELPPATQYQLPNIKDSNNKPVMAIPFKTKDVNEEVTSKDIKSLMEQANYTNKYLQALGETIKTKDDKIQRQLAKEKAQTKRDLETSEEEIETSSSVLSDENLNLIQQDDQLLSADDDDGQINTLTREQDLLFEAINSIPDPQEKKVFLEKLKKTLENTSRAPQIHYLTTLPVNSYRKVVMPPKASGISLRGGRSTGKGARLALLEPTIKKSSTFSGSPTQVGSSTQKTNLEGSSTQIASIKPEPSIQESPKPATVKQTSANYAWPIETLQALQDMGLTKFPKIIKKSWADIASESDDESESNLQTMIQNASMTKTATNTKGKLPLAKAQTPPTKQTNNYIYKNKFTTVLQMEPEFWDKNPFKATAKAFPPGFHYKPTTILKTRTFYELILVDSNSVSIKHFKDPKDQTLNTHSTIQILKVLQPRHFGSDLNKGKRFSVPFDPVGYTYWDYVDAWTKVFWNQNTRFKHSWLIYFKTNTIYNFPNWFLQWWDFFGPIPEIFPETVQQGFAQFERQYNSQESRIPADLKYFSSFALSWIFSWQYHPEQVKLWFQSHPEFLKAADPETSVFLNQKSHLAAFLAGSTSKEVLAKNLKEVLQMLQQEEEGSSSKKEETSSAEEDPFYQNEDDCFGICLD
ncbi:hypothetical protein HKD37_09G024923 [Glycine soja]